jgi:cyanate lyase
MRREDVTEKVVISKATRGLTWGGLAKTAGRSEVWTTSALLGQQAMGKDEAVACGEMLGLTAEEITLLQVPPSKGSLDPATPTDPLVYRFYEVLQVYGTTLKQLIHEKFGDGIMSAIDFEMEVERLPDPKGDRVKVTMHGKYLAYRKW